LLMVTPRYFPLSTTSRVWPCNVYDVWWNWRLPGTLITVHFSGWKHICHFLSHSSSDDRSFCRSTASWIFLMRRNSRQSSAKSLALHKMEFYGVRQNTLEWTKQFLTNRTQSVILENHKSDPLDVVSGVPQGTVMGPLLFLSYINDLTEATSSSARLFADDCLLFRRIRKIQDAVDLSTTSRVSVQCVWRLVKLTFARNSDYNAFFRMETHLPFSLPFF
jgi:hypothetical protein